MKNQLLRIEERARRAFEEYPFIHAFLAGVGVILFWRGVWEIADINRISPTVSVILGVLILGGIGLFIQTFIGNTLIIKKIKHEVELEKENKKEVTVVEREMIKEEITLNHLYNQIKELKEKIDHIEDHLK
jgi:hypothetical protein